MCVESFLTPEDFSARLRTDGPRALVDAHILAGLPYAFREAPNLYTVLRESLGDSLGVPAETIILVGSARTGFSLDTETFGRPFGEYSDLDITVISADLFDEVWFDLLRLSRRRLSGLREQVQAYVAEHRQTRIYNGRALPHQLGGATRVTGRWFKAFRDLSRVPDLSPYEVHGMLFRTREHAVLYYTYGLRRVLAVQEGGSE